MCQPGRPPTAIPAGDGIHHHDAIGTGKQVAVIHEKGEKVVMTGDDKKLRVESEKGIVEYGGDAKVPEGFPLTVMAGASVLGNAHHKGEGKEKKYIVCISSQAGCALACTFCSTGRVHQDIDFAEGIVCLLGGLVDRRFAGYVGRDEDGGARFGMV